jgi:Ca2+-binding RTX toxin-like protein
MPTKNGTIGKDVIDLRNNHKAPPSDWPVEQPWWTIDAKGGADVVYGSAFSDRILGGGGKDTLNGLDGNDSLEGGALQDLLYGGAGGDQLLGGTDDDKLYGEADNDRLIGEEGNDKLYGGDGDDGLFGDAGRDVLSGDAGNDMMFGGVGADQLIGGAGNDTLFGEQGNDTYVFNGLGFDSIFEGSLETGPRTGTKYDKADKLIVSYTSKDLGEKRDGNDLVIYSKKDAADGTLDSSVTLKDFYLGGHNVVETLITGDHKTIDLTGLLDV